MKISTRGKIELASHEGLSTQIYFDSVGVRTIGIGATVSEIPDLANWPLTDTLSVPDVMELFDKSLEKYERAIDSALKAEVTQQEYDSLVSLCYNIGCGGTERSSLIKYINSGFDMATIRMGFMMWNKPPEIIKRRQEEALLFTTGEYQTDGKTQLYETHGTGHIDWHAIKTINLFDFIK